MLYTNFEENTFLEIEKQKTQTWVWKWGQIFCYQGQTPVTISYNNCLFLTTHICWQKHMFTIFFIVLSLTHVPKTLSFGNLKNMVIILIRNFAELCGYMLDKKKERTLHWIFRGLMNDILSFFLKQQHIFKKNSYQEHTEIYTIHTDSYI